MINRAAVSAGDLPKDWQRLLELADLLVHELDRVVHVYNCYEATALWSRRYPDRGRVVNGTFAGVFSHSWIDLGKNAILDLYPVAGVRPHMVYVGSFVMMEPMYPLYRETKTRSSDDTVSTKESHAQA